MIKEYALRAVAPPETVWVPLRLPEGPIGTSLARQLVGLSEERVLVLHTDGCMALPMFKKDFDFEHRRVKVVTRLRIGKLPIGEKIAVSVRWGIGQDGEPIIHGVELCRSSKAKGD